VSLDLQKIILLFPKIVVPLIVQVVIAQTVLSLMVSVIQPVTATTVVLFQVGVMLYQQALTYVLTAAVAYSAVKAATQIVEHTLVLAALVLPLVLKHVGLNAMLQAIVQLQLPDVMGPYTKQEQ
jgi:hypothetical protein